MQIGPYQLQNNLILAPMAGVTDRPFRQLCRRFGAGLAVSEMVTADTSLWGSRKSQRRLQHRGEEGFVSVQILGTDPKKMAEAAAINVDLGAQIVDINMGCPAKKVCAVAAGSALLRDEPLVGRILETVVKAVTVPVTLKIRTGWDRSSRNAERIARIAEDAGIQALAIHGRTRADKFTGRAEYETIRRVKQSAGIPVIANGDIDSPQKALEVLASTSADAIMIGRAARGRPWIFEDIGRWVRKEEMVADRPPSWITELILEHLDGLYHFYGTEHGVLVARKHLAWYSKAYRGASSFRENVFKASTPKTQKDSVRAFFDGPSHEPSKVLAP